MIALGAVSVTGKEITVTHTRYAFFRHSFHADVVGRPSDDFLRYINLTGTS